MEGRENPQMALSRLCKSEPFPEDGETILKLIKTSKSS